MPDWRLLPWIQNWNRTRRSADSSDKRFQVCSRSAWAVATMRVASLSLLACIGISPDETVVIPILGSGETTANLKSGNSRLAKEIASSAGARFDPNCLSKQVLAPLHQQIGVDARDSALNDAKHQIKTIERSVVLLVDDIVMPGATMARIAEAVCRSNPAARVIGFALGRHQRPEWMPLSTGEANRGVPAESTAIRDRSLPR